MPFVAFVFLNQDPVMSSPEPEDPPSPPLNPIRTFPQYMDTFQKTYPTLEEMTFRETVFLVRE